MSSNAPLGRLVQRIAGAMHPHAPTLDDARSTRALFLALTKSFQSRLDEVYPGPSSRMQSSGSPFTLAKRHFDAITSHPVFANSPQAAAHRRQLDDQLAKSADSALRAYSDALERAEADQASGKLAGDALKATLGSTIRGSSDSADLIRRLVTLLLNDHPKLLASVLADKSMLRRILFPLLTPAEGKDADVEVIWSILSHNSPELSHQAGALFSRLLSASLRAQPPWFALQQIERAQSLRVSSKCPWFTLERLSSALRQVATHILLHPETSTSLWSSPICSKTLNSSTPPLKLDVLFDSPEIHNMAAANFLQASLWLTHPTNPSSTLALASISLLKTTPELLSRARSHKRVQVPYVHLCLKTTELLIKQENYDAAEQLLIFAGQEFPIFAASPSPSSSSSSPPPAASPTRQPIQSLVGEAPVTAAATAPQTEQYHLAVIRLCLAFVEQLLSKRKYAEAQRVMLFARERFPDVFKSITSASSQKDAMAVLDSILPA